MKRAHIGAVAPDVQGLASGAGGGMPQPGASGPEMEQEWDGFGTRQKDLNILMQSMFSGFSVLTQPWSPSARIIYRNPPRIDHSQDFASPENRQTPGPRQTTTTSTHAPAMPNRRSGRQPAWRKAPPPHPRLSSPPNRNACYNPTDHPHCISRYDLAGRFYFGPAPANLEIPPHRLRSPGEIIIPAKPTDDI